VSQCKGERPISGGVEFCILDSGHEHLHQWPDKVPPPPRRARDAGDYAELRAEVATLTRARDGLREALEMEQASALRGRELALAEVSALRARLAEVLEAGERFLAVADDVAKTAEVRWHRTQKAQEAAALSRAGKIEEGRAIVAELDRSPTVWDFGRTVDDLAEAAAAWRRAARRGQ